MLLLVVVLGIVSVHSAATGDDEVKQLMQDWDKYMRGFMPDDMISFQVEAGGEEIFVEKVTKPTLIRGTYFIPRFTPDTIDFQVFDPSGVMIFTKVMKKEAVFSIDAQQLGDYQLVFVNKRAKEPKLVTFALDVSESEKEEISQQDIDPLENNVAGLQTKVKDIFYGAKLSQMRSNNAFQQMKSANSKLMYLTFFETVAILVVSFWQVWFIKKLLNDRRLV